MNRIRIGTDVPWWRTTPWLLAIAIVPVAMVWQHWDPCDSTAAIASGNSVVSIGLALAMSVLVGLGIALDPSMIRSGYAWRNRRCLGLLAVSCLAAIVWLAWATVAVSGRGNLRFAANGFWQWTTMLLGSVSVGLLASQPRFVRLAITGSISLGVGILVYGFWEYGVIQPSLRMELENDPVALLRRQGIAPESSAAMLVADRIRSTELKGSYALANSMGGFLAGFWVLVLGFGILRRDGDLSSRKSRTDLGLAIILLLSIAIGLLLTKSRSAWIATGWGTLVLIGIAVGATMRCSRRMLTILVAASTVLFLIGLGVVYLFDPLILQEAGKSLAYRFDYWRGALTLIAREPWFGYGVGNFQSTYLHVKQPTAAESPADPHNFLLEVAHAGGVPMLLFVTTGIIAASWLAFVGHRVSDQQPFRSIREGAVAVAFWSGAITAIAGLLTWSLFTDSDERLLGTFLASLASIAAAIYCNVRSTRETSVHRFVQSSQVLWVVFAAMLIHELASGGWMLPGTMGLAMLAIGLAVGRGGDVGPGVIGSPQARLWQRSGVAGLGMLLAAAWWGTMAFPVLKGNEQMGLVFGGLLANPSPEQLRALANSDSWDPELPRLGVDWIAGRLSHAWGSDRRHLWENTLQDLQRDLVGRDPRNALAWDASGQASVRAAVSSADPESRATWLREADRAFQMAATLNPSSAPGHVQAALSASWVGDAARCLSHCREAEKIDSATPHRDRKLTAGYVLWPESLVPQGVNLGAGVRRGVPADCVKAEPILPYLRSQSIR